MTFGTKSPCIKNTSVYHDDVADTGYKAVVDIFYGFQQPDFLSGTGQ
jgi:hypothetical protein